MTPKIQALSLHDQLLTGRISGLPSSPPSLLLQLDLIDLLSPSAEPITQRLPLEHPANAGVEPGFELPFTLPLPALEAPAVRATLSLRAGSRLLVKTSTTFWLRDWYGQVRQERGGRWKAELFFRNIPDTEQTLDLYRLGARPTETRELLARYPILPVPCPHDPHFRWMATAAFPAAALERGRFELRYRGHSLTPSPLGDREWKVGHLDHISSGTLAGWAINFADPAAPVSLRLLVDGIVRKHFRPNVLRPDLQEPLALPDTAALWGFHLTPPADLFDGREHRIDVEFSDGTRLQGSGAWHRFATRPLSLSAVFPHLTIPAVDPRAGVRSANEASPRVSILVLNRNGADHLEALFESFSQINTVPAEWIVVDHASTDASRSVLERWQERLPLRLILRNTNDSFSASTNRAARLARTPYLLLLNNDIIWIQDILPGLIQTLETPGTGIVGLKLVKIEEGEVRPGLAEIQHLGVRFTLHEGTYAPYEIAPHNTPNRSPFTTEDVPAVTGAALLVRRDDYLRIGGLHPAYFYGFEDVEFCLRLHTLTGQRILCRNDLAALHRHGHTRLSGRARDVLDRQEKNATTLQRHIGLWLKRRAWQERLQGDSWLTDERLTIRIALPTSPASLDPALHARLERWCSWLLRRYPHAKLEFLDPVTNDWLDASGAHFLVALHPHYPFPLIKNARDDLILLSFVTGESATGRSVHPADYTLYLADDPAAAPLLLNDRQKLRATPESPLGWLGENELPPLRLGLVAFGSAPRSLSSSWPLEAWRRAGCLLRFLDEQPNALVDIELAYLHDPTRRRLPSPRPDRLGLLCLPPEHPVPPQAICERWQRQGWHLLTSVTDADRLQTLLEEALERTFRSP